MCHVITNKSFSKNLHNSLNLSEKKYNFKKAYKSPEIFKNYNDIGQPQKSFRIKNSKREESMIRVQSKKFYF